MQPLAGVVVLDFSTLLPGPLATLMLAEAGAEVIKIERPEGEDMRAFPPRFGSVSAPFAVLNRGKRFMALDLKDEAALEILAPLILRADVLVEQFRPGVMDRLGLGFTALRALNPRLIYCSITGYGQTGPRAAEPGHDLNYMARSGLLSLAPGTIAAPTVPPALVADIGGGALPAVINILLALRQRDLTGEGQHLDIAMTEGLFTFAWYALAQGHATGQMPGARDNPLTGASPRYALYPTADDRFVAMGGLEDKFWALFCQAIDLPPQWRDDQRDAEGTRAAVAALILAEPAAVWRARLEPLGCCASIVATLEEALADPQFAERGVFAHHVSEAGGRSMPACVVPLAATFRASPDHPTLVGEAGCDSVAIINESSGS